MGGIDYEEKLNIRLLDEVINLGGAAQVAWAYAKGDFAGISIYESSAIHFSFSDKPCWRVRIFARQRWMLPSVGSTASGIFCPLGF